MDRCDKRTRFRPGMNAGVPSLTKDGRLGVVGIDVRFEFVQAHLAVPHASGEFLGVGHTRRSPGGNLTVAGCRSRLRPQDSKKQIYR